MRKFSDLQRASAVGFFLLFSLLLGLGAHTSSQASETRPDAPSAKVETVSADFFEKQIQPIFNARCISCHSCFESPCQLNLQSYDGVLRGAHPENVYGGGRSLGSMNPARLYEDASSPDEWRKRGFYNIIGDKDSSLLLEILTLADTRKNARPKDNVRDNNVCLKSVDEIKKPLALAQASKIQRAINSVTTLAMPYGLPALSAKEVETLRQWIAAGAPGQSQARLGIENLSSEQKRVVHAWEKFLNRSGLKDRIVARYLYEHLFLASFYFSEPSSNSATPSLRLVRSSTKCSKAVTPIATRSPNDDPGVKNWHYCFFSDPTTVVYKKNIPYELSLAKLGWIEKNFATESWKATAFPSFNEEVSRNPFITFKDIPAEARYRFLLEDARYHIMTFIKGPVCNGSVAVNSIQEQFFVFFMDPKSDLMLTRPEFSEQSKKLLTLPATFDGESITSFVKDYKTLADLRNTYRMLHNRTVEAAKPQGYALSDLWNGDGKNRNAVLTVFRHDDNATVLYGARGDVSKTAFVLDYSIFERLVYNLVVNFDVYKDMKHQALTRLYMDLIRMEAENNYLEFLPQADRLPLKKDWYRGLLTELKLDVLKEGHFAKIPTQIEFKTAERKKRSVTTTHHELIEKILFDHMPAEVRGSNDILNWRKLGRPTTSGTPPETLNAMENQLSRLASVPAKERPFAKFFPEVALVLVEARTRANETSGSSPRIYTLIRNREHENIAWMFVENLRLDPNADTLTLIRGVAGGYPNQIFALSESEVPAFVRATLRIKNEAQYRSMRRKFGLDRMSPNFWTKFDTLQNHFLKSQPEETGYLDLSRYSL
ncbi:MAG: fatty acid cis/trans isomerase [Bdellovibrionales bacterium]|jgi:hypothetical protein|nr:fatty acid cis/trans isomerase [Bdellovibrionales bacterium]